MGVWDELKQAISDKVEALKFETDVMIEEAKRNELLLAINTMNARLTAIEKKLASEDD